MNNQDIYNPLYGSQGTASVNSPMSTLLSPLSDSEFLPLKDAISIYFVIFNFLYIKVL